jgi:hypothetical protein
MRRETQSGKSDYLLLAINARGLVMTSFESTIHLDFDRGFFDSAETGILSTAFEKAWAFVEFDPMLGVLEASRRQSELARCLMVPTEAWRHQSDLTCEFCDKNAASAPEAEKTNSAKLCGCWSSCGLSRTFHSEVTQRS